MKSKAGSGQTITTGKYSFVRGVCSSDVCVGLMMKEVKNSVNGNYTIIFTKLLNCDMNLIVCFSERRNELQYV